MTAATKKRVTILGATGTIGQNTLDLIERNREAFEIIALTGNKNIDLLAKNAIETKAEFVATADPSQYKALKASLSGTNIRCAAGKEGLEEAASLQSDMCMAAIVGVAGLAPTLKALENTKCLALANKECLVSAGALFMAKAKASNAALIPVDSEHSGAYQCLVAEQPDNIHKLTLTASGGPFRTATVNQLNEVTKQQALKHPNWEMGAKITIDSATLMNKGLELIEAKYLFSLQPDQVDMLVHPQSIIHCLVAMQDGSILAQMSEPDMRVPISYSLAWPGRMKTPIAPVDLTKLGQLTFEKGDPERFPCLELAKQALYNSESRGPVLNAANEVAVEAFLKEKITFMAIPEVISSVMDRFENQQLGGNSLTLSDIISLDQEARQLACDLLKFAA